MKISCIIPTRNRCRSVISAIESVIRQQHHQVEIILVDDGSTDNTIAEVALQFPGITTVKLPGVGPGPARNAGIAASRGEIIMFLDSDDLWLENHARQLVEVLERGYEVAYGVAESYNEIDDSVFLIPEKGAGLEGDCFEPLTRWCFLVPSAMALTRRAFLQAGPFPPLPAGEDWVFFLKLAACCPFGFGGPKPVTLRRLHRGSLCFISSRKKLLAIISQVLTFLENEPRAQQAHLQHLKKLHKWTAESPDRWTTVQDWYLALLKEKLI